MKLVEQFRYEMKRHGVSPDAKLLVAVSGGIDSMAMIEVVRKHYSNVAVAHVNFELRGSESDGDEDFVRKYCAEHNISIYVKHLPVDKKKVKDGIQETARKLRYAWFEQLRLAHGFDHVVTAHHAQDRLETFFMNLTRGAGVQGLKSIPGKTKYLLRPFLKILKSDIEAYARLEHLGWRVDSSNAKLDYLRNRVRHGLIGEFSGLSAAANAQASLSLDYLTEADSFFLRASNRLVNSYKRKGRCIFMSDAEWTYLFEEPPLHKYVFEALGFKPDRLGQLKGLIEKQSGKMVEGDGVIAYRNRGGFVIDNEPEKEFEPVAIEDLAIGLSASSKVGISKSREISSRAVGDGSLKSERRDVEHRGFGVIHEPVSLSWRLVDIENEEKIKGRKRALFDLEKLVFPLVLRPWKPGDVIYPVGLKGKKKISDLLTDIKLSIPEKKDVLVLESAGEICWVLGLRIDERFQASRAGKAILFELDGERDTA